MEANSNKKWMNFEESLFDSSLNFKNKNELEKQFRNNSSKLLREYSRDWMQYLDPYQISDKAQQNLDDLKSGKAVAVITGQQPCLLTGPSLVLHKTFTAISLCNYLNSIGVRAVPIFWNASEDHDLSEILRTTFYTENNQLDQIRLHASLEKLSAETLAWSAELEEMIQSRSSFALELCSDGPKESYSDHFNSLMLKLFSDDGLLVIEPHWLKGDSKPFWNKVDEKKEAIVNSFAKDEKHLIAEGKDLQVFRRHSIPLFKIDKVSGRRIPLKHENGFWSDGLLSSKELETFTSPKQRLSPGALLRPAFAQAQLPIIASVLGPGEMSYHHQNKSLFEVLDLPRPLLFPRLGGTWISEAMKKECVDFGLDVSNLLKNGFGDIKNLETEKIFSDKLIKEVCDKIELEHSELSKLDLQLILSQIKTRTNMLSESFERKLWKAEQKGKGLSVKRLHQIMNIIKPKGKLQERSICAFSFIKNRDHFKKIQSEFENCFDNRHRIYS
jgi:bacillithiol biosynthesis cysteine-adding enzyme BshC